MNGPVRAHAAMLLFALLVSTTFSLGSLYARDIDPLALTFLRFLVAGLIYTAIVVALRRWRMPTLPEAGQALALGITVATFFISNFVALQTTGATEAGAILALIPLITTGIAAFTLGQRPSARLLAGLCVAAAGVVYVVFRGSLAKLLAFDVGYGELVLLFGCAAYACYSPLIRGLDRGTPALLVSYWTVIAGFLVIGVYGARTVAVTDWAAVPWRAYLGILHLAIFTTISTFFLMQYASTRLPQAKVVAYAYLTPVFVLFTEVLITGAWPSLPVLVGVGVIASAMVVLQTA